MALDVFLDTFFFREYSFPFRENGAAKKSSVFFVCGVINHSSDERVSLVENLRAGNLARRSMAILNSPRGRIQVGLSGRGLAGGAVPSCWRGGVGFFAGGGVFTLRRRFCTRVNGV